MTSVQTAHNEKKIARNETRQLASTPEKSGTGTVAHQLSRVFDDVARVIRFDGKSRLRVSRKSIAFHASYANLQRAAASSSD